MKIKYTYKMLPKMCVAFLAVTLHILVKILSNFHIICFTKIWFQRIRITLMDNLKINDINIGNYKISIIL